MARRSPKRSPRAHRAAPPDADARARADPGRLLREGEALGHPRGGDGRARHRAAHERDDALQALRLEGRAGARRWSTRGRSSSRRSTRSTWAKVDELRAPRSRCCWSGRTRGPRASSDVSPAFFQDLHRDHPDVLGALQARRSTSARWSAATLPRPVPARRPARRTWRSLMLDHLVMQASDPRFAERLGISRREAVRTAVSVWGGGALLQRAEAAPPALLRPRARLTRGLGEALAAYPRRRAASGADRRPGARTRSRARSRRPSAGSRRRARPRSRRSRRCRAPGSTACPTRGTGAAAPGCFARSQSSASDVGDRREDDRERREVERRREARAARAAVRRRRRPARQRDRRACWRVGVDALDAAARRGRRAPSRRRCAAPRGSSRSACRGSRAARSRATSLPPTVAEEDVRGGLAGVRRLAQHRRSGSA